MSVHVRAVYNQIGGRIARLSLGRWRTLKIKAGDEDGHGRRTVVVINEFLHQPRLFLLAVTSKLVVQTHQEHTVDDNIKCCANDEDVQSPSRHDPCQTDITLMHPL